MRRKSTGNACPASTQRSTQRRRSPPCNREVAEHTGPLLRGRAPALARTASSTLTVPRGREPPRTKQATAPTPPAHRAPAASRPALRPCAASLVRRAQGGPDPAGARIAWNSAALRSSATALGPLGLLWRCAVPRWRAAARRRGEVRSAVSAPRARAHARLPLHARGAKQWHSMQQRHTPLRHAHTRPKCPAVRARQSGRVSHNQTVFCC